MITELVCQNSLGRKFMPKAGDEHIASCKKCGRKTTWRYVHWVVKTFWMCLTCEARRADK
jgi:hypothetical protein